MMPGVSKAYVSRYIAGSIGSGMLLAMAFPPLEWSGLAWIAVIPLMLMLRDIPLNRAFLLRWISGAVFWLLSLSWLLRLAFTGTNMFVAMLAWISLSAYCALYTGAFSMVVAVFWQKVGPVNEGKNVLLVFFMPLVWVGFEYLRSTLFTGFSWNALGISQYRQIPVIQVADLAGVYAVSAFIVAVNAAVMFTALRLIALYRRQPVRKINVEMMLAVCLWGLCVWYFSGVKKNISLHDSRGTSVRVASVQPNIPQYKKWPLQYEKEIYSKVREQTELAMSGEPDIIIWPETVVPSLVRRDPECAAFVSDLARRGFPILVGSLDCEIVGEKEAFYNSSILISTNGFVVDQYNKRHLVLFGEYLPFEHIFPFIQKFDPLGYSCTPGVTSTVFRMEKPAVSFSSLICFEDTVTSLARESVRNGARMLVNQTNDAWFDGSSAAVQHMAHCIFRCVENRVPAVRSANTGVTCFIDAFGRVEMLQNEGRTTCFAGFATGSLTLPPSGMALSFYTRYGDMPFAIPCCILALLCLAVAVVTVRSTSNVSAIPKSGPAI